MIKYILKECYGEIKYDNRYDISEGCITDSDGRVVQEFTDKEVALKELRKYKTLINLTSNFARMKLFSVWEYHLEEVVCDDGEDISETLGEWVSKMEIAVCNRQHDELGIFNKYEDAERFKTEKENELGETLEIFF